MWVYHGILITNHPPVITIDSWYTIVVPTLKGFMGVDRFHDVFSQQNCSARGCELHLEVVDDSGLKHVTLYSVKLVNSM